MEKRRQFTLTEDEAVALAVAGQLMIREFEREGRPELSVLPFLRAAVATLAETAGITEQIAGVGGEGGVRWTTN